VIIRIRWPFLQVSTLLFFLVEVSYLYGKVGED
jgi:hypothetical protein